MRMFLMSGVVVLTVSSALAGPYSSFQGPSAAVDSPIPRASLSVFEASIIQYSPAPGVGPNFRSPTTGIASLGDLYSPVLKPGGVANSPFNKVYQPQPGTEPNASHNGSGAANFSPFGGNLNDPLDTCGFIGIDQPGSITLGFGGNRIFDAPGADFAVFENGFAFGGPTSLFAELAYVEVSSNGQDFARFASISTNLAPTGTAGTAQGFDVTNIYNLAGKHATNWGTPFDLGELATNPLVTGGLLDLSQIRYVRLVDVIGSGPLTDSGGNVIPGIARDSLGNPILDNWVTFDSAGFDYLGLPTGAVGAMHFAAVPEPGTLVFAVTLGICLTGVAARKNMLARRKHDTGNAHWQDASATCRPKLTGGRPGVFNR
jgi:hypothetical protein